MSLCLIIDYVTYLCLKEIFFRPRHIFFTYPDKPVRGGKGAGQAGAELGAGHGQQASQAVPQHSVCNTEWGQYLFVQNIRCDLYTTEFILG